ncbi:MAG TPA: UDP-3-O-(3-hydroxymyristoyl)glucosamine N-acyltransferase [Acidobacteriaceae bacterium]|nr:UDP-3-O-(3-hydroxymyristoyl)glucosamine N-acyltransferase [Acidobacteriaceae bacterium]
MASLQEIAELVGAPRPSLLSEIRSVSSIEAATPTSLVFATDPGSLVSAIHSPAAAILTRPNLAPAEAASTDPRLLAVPDPRYAFALAAHFLAARAPGAAPRNSAPDIHPTAVLASDVQLGRRTHIGPHAVLEQGVVIGDDCILHANVTIHSGVTLGDRITVQSGAVLGSAGFGYAHNPATGAYLLFPQQGTLTLEDDVDIGANTTIDRGALGETRIGAGTKIDNLVHIAHNCIIGRNVIIAAQTGISGSSRIEDGAILGGQVGLGEHAHVGPGVILGGGAGVLSHKKVRGPGQVFWGRPARPLNQYLRDLARLSRR